MRSRNIERRFVAIFRYFCALAVLGSFAGAVLMFVLGLARIYEAYAIWIPAIEAKPDAPLQAVPRSALSMIGVIEALDRFLIAIVLLYFGFGIYSLFIHPEVSEEELGLPPLLHVDHIGQLKQVVAEVIIVILFVLFLRTALQVFQSSETVPEWPRVAMLLALPVCTALLALALKLVELHPKPERPASAIVPPPPTTGED